MDLVAQRCVVSRAFAGAKTARGRVVLDHVVIPVAHPEGAVGAHFRANRRGPLVVAGDEVAPVVRGKIRAARFDMEFAEEVAGGLCDELHAVPVFRREIPRRINRAARSRGVTPVIIHLPDLVGDRIKALAVRDGRQHARRPAIDRFVIAIGDRHIHARVAVRRGAEDDIVLGDAKSPGVVVAGTNKLQLRAVGPETEDALPEPDVLAADGAAETRVAHRAPDPVVKTVAQVARRRVRVAHAPA